MGFLYFTLGQTTKIGDYPQKSGTYCMVTLMHMHFAKEPYYLIMLYLLLQGCI